MNGQSENNDLRNKFANYSYPVDDTNWEAISAGIPYGNEKGLLSSTFASYAVQPSSQVWDRIDAVLRPSSGRRAAAWWWSGAAASILLLAIFTFVKYNSTEVHTPIAEQHVKTEKQTNVSNAAETPNPTTTNANSISSEGTQTESNSSFAEAATLTAANTEKQSQTVENAILSGKDNAVADLTRDGGAISAVSGGYDESIHVQQYQSGDENSFAQSIDKIGAGISLPSLVPTLAPASTEVAFAVSETSAKKVKSSPFYDGTEKHASQQYSILAGSQLAFAGSGSNENADYFTTWDGTINTGSLAESASLIESVNYSTPVYYGVNGEIEFLKRLAAGTGLGYLQMRKSSEFTTGGPQSTKVDTRNRYLSIPVYLKFNFIHKPKFSAYASLGNAFDIQIWNQTTTETYVNGDLTNTDVAGTSEKGNQANIYTGLGLTFKFTKNVGLYAEGSLMRYYYTSNPNFYSQQNLWPGLRFGAVVSF